MVNIMFQYHPVDEVEIINKCVYAFREDYVGNALWSGGFMGLE